MSKQSHRRAFLRQTAWVSGGWCLLCPSRLVWSSQANEKLNLAVVGVGSRGTYLAERVQRLGQNLVALCDVDRRRAEVWRQKAPDIPWYADFRRMLDEHGQRLDGVMAALPCHSHGAVAAAAMQRGKHVYVEKPIGHNARELAVLRHIAAERKVVTQMGNQGMATDSFRRTVELVRDGAIGEVRDAYLWCVGAGPGPRDVPTREQPVPDYLDWDLWLGPRPFRPFHSAWLGTWSWREFGTGMLGGWGSHAANMIFLGLRLGALWGTDGDAAGTIRVRAEPSEVSAHTYPRFESTQFDIPARGDLPAARLHWHFAPRTRLEEQGVWRRLEEIAGQPPIMEGSWMPDSGSILAGSKGVVHTNSHNSICHMLPQSDFPAATGPPRQLRRVPGQSHDLEWMQACRGNGTPLSNLNHSGPVMELLLLSHVASLFPRQTLEYDPKRCAILNLEDANRRLSWPRREGWEL